MTHERFTRVAFLFSGLLCAGCVLAAPVLSVCVSSYEKAARGWIVRMAGIGVLDADTFNLASHEHGWGLRLDGSSMPAGGANAVAREQLLPSAHQSFATLGVWALGLTGVASLGVFILGLCTIRAATPRPGGA